MTRSLTELEDQLGHRFVNPELLKQALTHPSFASEYGDVKQHNQRLEYLGDAVLQLVVARQLYDLYPERQEGDLSRMRSAICQQEGLVALARQIELGGHLRLGRGEEQSGGRERASSLADAFEAVLGALYLEAGLATVEGFLGQLVRREFPDPEAVLSSDNPKGMLQEQTQRLQQATPDYATVAIDGPEHDPVFRVTVSLRGRQLAIGEGSTRKRAEQAAAQAALDCLAAELAAELATAPAAPAVPAAASAGNEP